MEKNGNSIRKGLRTAMFAMLAASMAGAVLFSLARTSDAAAPDARGAVIAYVWGNDAKAAAAYTPSASYAYNAKKGAITITRTGVGAYDVKIAGAKTTGGNAVVSAYGSGPEHCKPVSWSTSGADEIVKVACFSGTAAADAQFSLLFTN